MKACTKCAQVLPSEAFAKQGKKGRRAVCKPCWNSYVREYKSRNPERERQRNRAYKQADPERYLCSHLRSIHGISLAEYRRMEAEQGGKCAVCRQPETARYKVRGLDKVKSLAVDHCHDTGRIRGLLCANCNTALGLLGEDPDRSRALAEYIEFNNDIPLRYARLEERHQ